jgi:hypothetical protein
MKLPQELKYKLLDELKQIQANMAKQAEAQQALEGRKVDIEAAKVVNSAVPGTFGGQQ